MLGISFGDSDAHICSHIGEGVKNRDNLIVLCFERSLPDKGYDLLAHNRKEDKKATEPLTFFGLKDTEENKQRLLIYSSDRIFNFEQFRNYFKALF